MAGPYLDTAYETVLNHSNVHFDGTREKAPAFTDANNRWVELGAAVRWFRENRKQMLATGVDAKLKAMSRDEYEAHCATVLRDAAQRFLDAREADVVARLAGDEGGMG